ncbi:recombinase family protein [Clostridium sp. SHJSY1]|uniref:recombinase family protein n=1 Tax=Clostridium sp. SHJSY1 TaxID=2942483 RepID=UPI00287599BE|nr:recombinase family protein [Clostridium sp. SHJSY1]MDS0528420.1 recombinase family protein [Clostridium sp. SHJSY1]
MNKVWNIAIYARVSTDKKEQSESIPVQVENLKKWILNKSREDKSSVYNLIDVYQDQGISGSSFERESFIKMKEDIENKKINMIVTRDLSRFSRNYILAGYYLEDYFKVNNIRFISVLDNVDTESEFDNDIIPFKNILNEMYIKDCSRKVRSALLTRMERGSSIASKPPYGYKFEEVYEKNQKNIKLISAEDESTQVVKEIFTLYLSGWGAGKIASYLNKQGIDPPSKRIKNFARKKFGKWNNNTIISILKNPKYGGYMVQGKYKKVSYKVKKINIMPIEQCIYGGEFEGIISKDVFERTQQMMKERSNSNYRYKNGVIHAFSAVLKCGKCGGSMTYRQKYKGYKCTNSQQGAKRCSPHSIKETRLIEIVSNEIKSMIDEKIDKNKVYNKFNNIKIENDFQNELKSVEKELNALDSKLKKIYEDRLDNVINQRNFDYMIQNVQEKQNKMIGRKNQLVNMLKKNDVDNDLLKKYKIEIDNLLEGKTIDRRLVETLIDKIIIDESNEGKEKRLIIHYKFSK